MGLSVFFFVVRLIVLIEEYFNLYKIIEIHCFLIIMDREEFAKRLNGAIVPQGTTIEEMNRILRPISEAVFQLMPTSLYRYRKCDKMQIDAFENDTIYAVTTEFVWLVA